MATSVTSQGLVAGADKVILAARPYLEFTKLFSTNFQAVGSTQYSGIAVNVLAAISGVARSRTRLKQLSSSSSSLLC